MSYIAPLRSSSIYSIKSVRPKMESWEIPLLTAYSCKKVPSRSTPSRLLLRNDKVMAKTEPEISYNLGF